MFRLEQVDLDKCMNDLVTVHFVDLEITGAPRDLAASDYRLAAARTSGGMSGPPVRQATFSQTDIPLTVVLVVQVDATFRRDFGDVREGLADLLRALPAQSRTAGLAFDDTLVHLGRSSAGELADAVVELEATEAHAGSTLLQALARALADFRDISQRDAPGRRIMIVVSDGLPGMDEREEIRALGDEAAAALVQIMPIAFSPSDDRPRLLALGELAKRSRGTLRWAERRSDLSEKLYDLAAEISSRRALTYHAPELCKGTHSIQVNSGTRYSTPWTISAVSSSGHGVSNWSLYLGGTIVLLAILGGATRKAWQG